MPEHLCVLLNEQEYAEIQEAARVQRVTVAEWVRQALRKVRDDQSRVVETKLRAIADASRHRFPTADVGDMLREIEAGRHLS